MSFNSPDCILYNGTFLSMNEKEDVYRAVAIKDGKITAVSRDEPLIGQRGFATELVDMQGKTVLPGFIDCNVHMVQSGINQYCINLHADSNEEFLESLASIVKGYGEGELIWCVGFEAEGEQLSRWDLDKISSNHPIVVSRMEFHHTIVNTNAYNLLAIPPSIRGIEKDEKGMPTGRLKGEASGFARRKTNSTFVNEGMRRKSIAYMVRKAITMGITTLNAMEGGYFFCDDDMGLVQAAAKQCPIDLLLFPQTLEIEEAKALGVNRIGGNIYVDGTIGSRTAAVSRHYEDEEENLGLLYYTQDELNQFIIDAHNSGMQIGVSCIGDRAIEQALNAFDLAFRLNGRKNHRHRMELFVLPTEQQIERAIKLNLIFSMRPNYDFMWGGSGGLYRKNLGDSYRLANPIGKIVKLGGIVAGGSECSVTPLEPMIGIYSAVNHHEEDCRVSVKEALKMYTVHGAYANFMEHTAGKIEVGYNADMAVLDKNPLDVSKDELADIQVVKTIKKGAILYG